MRINHSFIYFHFKCGIDGELEKQYYKEVAERMATIDS